MILHWSNLSALKKVKNYAWNSLYFSSEAACSQAINAREKKYNEKF
jgi:hypothetical protein